ncbi:MAG: hypothetical protein SCM11_00240 [Bacillota bacterium]|nr:hypothetical protein [Bacillota bacterium]
MIKKRTKQLTFHDWPSGFHGARIFQGNRWVKMTQIIPWDLVEKKYTEAFTGKQTGNPSVIFNGEEILYETKGYAVISNIVDANLYQASRADIIGTQLNCLAQVKRIYPEGTELMKNTIFTKIKDPRAKKDFIEAMSSFADGNIFDFEASAIASIHDKPVYQLEIIALYQ